MTVAALESAPDGVRIGTSSLRRAAQLRRAFPGCIVEALRGNLDTRLRRVEEKIVDAAVLAAAGIRRLGATGITLSFFKEAGMLPAPGQGALGLEIREGDGERAALLQAIRCARTEACVTAERTFLASLQGGCRAPIAALGRIRDDQLILAGRVLSPDGTRCVEGEESGPGVRASDVGRRLAERLLSAGAADVLSATAPGSAEA
jgi:hydroxymethylbilane synthase